VRLVVICGARGSGYAFDLARICSSCSRGERLPPWSHPPAGPGAKWRQDVDPTVIAMAGEMGPDELTMRAVAHRMGLQEPQVWRVLPKGRSDILLLVAASVEGLDTRDRSPCNCHRIAIVSEHEVLHRLALTWQDVPHDLRSTRR